MNRKQVILHLGAPKTATTSLQFCLLRSSAALAAEGIIYPAFRHGRELIDRQSLLRPKLHEQIALDWRWRASHASLFWLCQTRFPPGFLYREELQNYDKDWTDTLENFRNGPARHLIVSFEGALFNQGSFDLNALRERLQGLSITLMIMLRSPGALLGSLFATHVTGRPRSTGRAVDQPAMRHYLAHGYAGLITHLEQVLAPDRTLLNDMGRLFTPPRGLMGNFLDLAGLYSQLDDSLHVNTSLPADAILMVRRLNRRQLDNDAWRDTLKGLHAWFEANPAPRDNTSFLPPATQQRLAEQYEEDRSALAALHDVTLAPAGSILPLQTDPAPGSEAAILSRIWPDLAPTTRTALRQCLPASCPA